MSVSLFLFVCVCDTPRLRLRQQACANVYHYPERVWDDINYIMVKNPKKDNRPKKLTKVIITLRIHIHVHCVGLLKMMHDECMSMCTCTLYIHVSVLGMCVCSSCLHVSVLGMCMCTLYGLTDHDS